ncbi:MAG: hypothetical protein GY712_04890 [Oceanicoccus sp.]|uniref:hypothetical protein n=1 Tax=Oceanicoccus sp. TaxID=2691044 RepID=UPI0026077FAA|nr:hypothetical protein [Oceanicoccus sp.]MCP3907335.1 hypothetical protein [Oceanicoccus sp.]
MKTARVHKDKEIFFAVVTMGPLLWAIFDLRKDAERFVREQDIEEMVIKEVDYVSFNWC